MTSVVPTPAYPVRVDASFQPRLSRWLWLVKWLLLIPHFVVLAFLWIAFALLSVVAFVSILVTGRYPRPIFDFNVGVLRWHWRVAYYSYAAFGTDRYPPFTLAEVPEYPAHLDIAYPERLSRGLVLVKWWLLAIPHYLVIALFAGTGAWAGWEVARSDTGGSGPGLIGLLALIAVVVLAFTGQYPRSIFDFLLGMNRWVLRVAAYAGLMTDRYPPFRLDMGGREPTVTLPPRSPVLPVEPAQPSPPSTGSEWTGGWTAGRVVSVVAGAVLGLASFGLLGAGGVGLWADQTQRQGGYVTTGVASYHTPRYGLVSETVEFGAGAHSVVGDVRLRVTPDSPGQPTFVGIAPADAASAYLAAVGYTTVSGAPSGGITRYTQHPGGAPATPPAQAGIWVAQASGTGTQVLDWTAQDGRWAIVVMNADTTPGVAVRVDAGATAGWLGWVAAVVLTSGVVLLLVAVVLVAVPIARMRTRTAGAPPDAVPPVDAA